MIGDSCRNGGRHLMPTLASSCKLTEAFVSSDHNRGITRSQLYEAESFLYLPRSFRLPVEIRSVDFEKYRMCTGKTAAAPFRSEPYYLRENSCRRRKKDETSDSCSATRRIQMCDRETSPAGTGEGLEAERLMEHLLNQNQHDACWSSWRRSIPGDQTRALMRRSWQAGAGRDRVSFDQVTPVK
jgi:hypothetical protein